MADRFQQIRPHVLIVADGYRYGGKDFPLASKTAELVSALRDLMNNGALTAQVGWALLGCATVAAIFIPLALRSYSRRV